MPAAAATLKLKESPLIQGGLVEWAPVVSAGVQAALEAKALEGVALEGVVALEATLEAEVTDHTRPGLLGLKLTQSPSPVAEVGVGVDHPVELGVEALASAAAASAFLEKAQAVLGVFQGWAAVDRAVRAASRVQSGMAATMAQEVLETVIAEEVVAVGACLMPIA